MKPFTVTINGRINVDGIWWDIEVDFMPDGVNTYNALRDEIEASIRAMSKVRIVSSLPVSGPSPSLADIPTKAGPGLSGGYVPVCPEHKQAMDLSKHQSPEKPISYYCPIKSEGKWCNWRGSADRKKAGRVKTWEKGT